MFEWLSDGYQTFRIPGIVQSANGALKAATAEGRVAASLHDQLLAMPVFTTVSWRLNTIADVWIKT